MAVDTGCFTVGVFKDVQSASKGLDALKHRDFPVESLSIVARETPEASTCIASALGRAPDRLELARVGTSLVAGPLIAALGGPTRDFGRLGLAATLRRVGFQDHDGEIYERLVARGGILVAIHGEPRAADALAVLFSYGGGNAAIGAWAGRV